MPYRLLTLGLAFSIQAVASCETFLLPTSELISYLETLIERRVLEPDDLARFTNHLSQKVLLNPLARANTRSTVLVHRQRLEQLLTTVTSAADIEDLHRWAQERLTNLNEDALSRQHIRTETQRTDMEFETFTGNSHDNTVTRSVPPFQVMSHLVTRAEWAALMGAAPESHPAIRGSADEDAFPVTALSWWSALAYANRRSESEGLEPYYRLDALQWKGDAALGTLEPSNLPSLSTVSSLTSDAFRNPQGPHGYRLPTGDEIHYLFKTEEAALSSVLKNAPADYDNVTFLSAAVGSPAIFVDGQTLYDFVGGVMQWMDSGIYETFPIVVSHAGKIAAAFGGRSRELGHLRHIITNYRTRNYVEFDPDIFLGLRLARTLPENTAP